MKFELRDWRESDMTSLVASANNPSIAKNMTDGFPSPYTEEAARKFIEFATAQQPTLRKAICVNDKACGAIGLYPLQDINRLNAELGYWLAEEHWGKGIITAAIKQMVDYGFSNFPITRIFARPFENNIASQRALERAGFKLEARISKALIKNEVVMDELIYAIRKPNS